MTTSDSAFLQFIEDKAQSTEITDSEEAMKEQQLRVVIADSDEKVLDALNEKLKSFGHDVVMACTSGEDLVAACLRHRPSLIIADLGVTCKSEDLIAAVHKFCDKIPTPVIIISEDTIKDRDEVSAGARSVSAHLVRPVSAGSLAACISISMSSFERYAAACKEIVELKWAIHERRLIERAKSILISRANLTEGEAHTRLQGMASTRNIKMSAVAEIIITAEIEFVKSLS